MKPTEEKIHSSPSDLPVYLFKQGNNCEAYRYFGAHIEQRAGETGVVFRVWAPHAVAISVVGDFNSWKPGSHPMRKVDGDSVWELFIPGMKEYDVYKYCAPPARGIFYPSFPGSPHTAAGGSFLLSASVRPPFYGNYSSVFSAASAGASS